MATHPRSFASDSPILRRDDLAGQWAALHEAAAIVAGLAGAPLPDLSAPAGSPAGLAAFPAALRRAGGWRLSLGRQGLADLSAILEGGIRALLAVHAAGGTAGPAAQALWEEFVSAREGLLALVPAAEPLHGS